MDKLLDLKRAKEICEKATPGGWAEMGRPPIPIGRGIRPMVADTDWIIHDSSKMASGDIQFICGARTLLPQAISEIEKLRIALNLAGRILDDALTWGFIDEEMVDAAHKCIRDAQILTGQKGLND